MHQESKSAASGRQGESVSTGLRGDGLPSQQGGSKRPIMFAEFWRNSSKVSEPVRAQNPVEFVNESHQGQGVGSLNEIPGPLKKISASTEIIHRLLADGAGGAFDELTPTTPSARAGQGGAALSPCAVGAEGQAASMAPDTCNTGAMNRQTGQEDRNPALAEALETGGPDTLKLSYQGEWEQVNFLALSKQLDAAQVEAQTGQGGAGLIELPAGDRWKVLPSGSRQGEGGLYYRWVVEWDGNRICILNRGGHSPHAPNILVQLGSLALMTRGLEELEAALRGMLADAGFRIIADVPGEIHVCVDLPGREVAEFTRLAMNGCEVTKAKKGKLFFGATSDNHETYYRGNGKRVLMRIYDKLAETENDPEKRAFLIARRWAASPNPPFVWSFKFAAMFSKNGSACRVSPISKPSWPRLCAGVLRNGIASQSVRLTGRTTIKAGSMSRRSGEACKRRSSPGSGAASNRSWCRVRLWKQPR